MSNHISVAFHGQFSSPRGLRRDAGAPEFIDLYLSSTDDISITAAKLARLKAPLLLIGYSLGGTLAMRLVDYDLPIKGLILYEAPVFDTNSMPAPSTDIKVLSIWNDYIPKTHPRRVEKARSRTYQRSYPYYTELTGLTRAHTKFIFRPPFVGHGWDISLNSLIQVWIKCTLRT